MRIVDYFCQRKNVESRVFLPFNVTIVSYDDGMEVVVLQFYGIFTRNACGRLSCAIGGDN